MNSLSVIIPTKTASNLVACLRALRENEPHVRVLIIDDGLPANWHETADFRIGCGAVFQGPRPFIFARNINIGIEAAANDDVILLNDDALLQSPGGFGALQREAEQHHEYGIIGAVTNITGQPLQKPQAVGLREVPHLAFVCVLIPRRTIDQIGLLDERYCLDYGVEDRDYCEAVTRAGMKVGVYDHCYVDHGSLVSTYRGDPRAPRSYVRNQQLFHQKWGIA